MAAPSSDIWAKYSRTDHPAVILSDMLSPVGHQQDSATSNDQIFILSHLLTGRARESLAGHYWVTHRIGCPPLLQQMHFTTVSTFELPINGSNQKCKNGIGVNNRNEFIP